MGKFKKELEIVLHRNALTFESTVKDFVTHGCFIYLGELTHLLSM